MDSKKNNTETHPIPETAPDNLDTILAELTEGIDEIQARLLGLKSLVKELILSRKR